ncbi:hypothetical protein N825_33580 [Skermanella stibiiresistens SB22]|uniref:Uncharacterized protein n=1 Tax=Skermanella stibiiresistens SB22 TaxID=1385369 RepID=W9H488_9PROT|nr:hypothetical protein N825_33580 [Skermanella stibiiresistens SB22]
MILPWRDRFQFHVTRSLGDPFIVLFEEDRADEAGDGRFFHVMQARTSVSASSSRAASLGGFGRIWSAGL